MADKEPISVVALRLIDALGCCSNPWERFAAERVERATGVPSEQVHEIAQGLHSPSALTAERLRLLDRAMQRFDGSDSTFEEWLLLRPAGSRAAPVLLIRELRRDELALLVG